MAVTTKNPICKRSLKILGDFWTMLIIDMLSDGPLRFGDLERRLETVNTATLSARLKKMQSAGLIIRHEISRADVHYELSELGKKALPILAAVNDFAAESHK